MYLALACTDLSVSGFSIKTLFPKFSHFNTFFHLPALSSTFWHATCKRHKPQTKKATQNKLPAGQFRQCCSTTHRCFTGNSGHNVQFLKKIEQNTNDY
jgi:hypothetical protein